MDFLTAAFNKSQEYVDGKVMLQIYKGNVMTVARESPTSLYDQDLGSMHKIGGFNQEDSRGFIKINAIRLMAHRAIINKIQKLRSGAAQEPAAVPVAAATKSAGQKRPEIMVKQAKPEKKPAHAPRKKAAKKKPAKKKAAQKKAAKKKGKKK
jgi:hypothetical protein